MVSIASLWLPIVLSAVAVWIASFLVWAVLPFHKSDFKKVPNEADARKALAGIGPGQYNLPHVMDRKDLEKPDERAKFEQGPIGFLTILPNGVPGMGKNLVLTILFYLVVSVVVAYVTGRTLDAGTDYLSVFRVSGTVAWAAYGLGMVPDAIWFGRPWSAVGKNLVDALVYAVLTAGFFGWLYPGAGA